MILEVKSVTPIYVAPSVPLSSMVLTFKVLSKWVANLNCDFVHLRSGDDTRNGDYIKWWPLNKWWLNKVLFNHICRYSNALLSRLCQSGTVFNWRFFFATCRKAGWMASCFDSRLLRLGQNSFPPKWPKFISKTVTLISVPIKLTSEGLNNSNFCLFMKFLTDF